MSDAQLARRIVQCFKEDHVFLQRSEPRTLMLLYQCNLSNAFSWADTKEGYGFWYTLHNMTLRTCDDLRNFLKKNLIEDPNFIELELYI